VRPNRKLSLLCLLLLALSACGRKHDGGDFLPTAPAFQQALQIVLAALSLPADGASMVRIEAQISPDADADRRTIRFQTTLGGFVEPDSSMAPVQRVDKQADVEGKAAVFLQSGTTLGTAVVTVSVVGNDDAGNEVVFATVHGEVEFTRVEDAIVLTVTPESNFADGVSPVILEAQISADSPPAWSQVTFTTSLGVLDNTAGQTSKLVSTDASRIARAQLTSVQVGTATITASIAQFPAASATRLVSFALRNPDAVRIGASDDSVPADGASQISVFADIADGLASRNVVFTTTGGRFLNADVGNDQQKTVAADAGNRATVRLEADQTIGGVLLTATVDLDAGIQQSDNLEIEFRRALPNFIQLTADPSPASKAGDMQSTITAALSRNLGTVSENTVIEYTVEKADGSAITDMEFRDVTRSDPSEVSTAELYFGDTAEALPLVVVIKASPAGSSVTGQVSMTINP
jgi:hypothetical protein